MRSMHKRLEKLEQARQRAFCGKGHWIICETNEEPEAKIAALHASPEWEEGDRIVLWRVVDPPCRETV